MSNNKAKARSDEQAGGVHTSAQPQFDAAAGGCSGCGGCGSGCKDKPLHHQPSAPMPRDAFTGIAGRYARDPVTGVRTPITSKE